jgi:chemotaxis protein histidine kinase CheA
MAAQAPPNQITFNIDAGEGQYSDNFPNGQQAAGFNTDIQGAIDFGFNFTRLDYINPNNNNKGSFVVNIEFFNGLVGQPGFATWQLTLENLLDAGDTILKTRFCADLKKDLMCATTSLSANGAVETLRKFMRDVFDENTLKTPLNTLLTNFKDFSPPPGETIVDGVLSSPGHNFAIPPAHIPVDAIYFRDSGPKSSSVDTTCSENPLDNPLGNPNPHPNVLTVDVIKNALNGNVNRKFTKFTIANMKDPATNSNKWAFYSPRYVNFTRECYSAFYGVNVNALEMSLNTRRVDNNHKHVLCDVRIKHRFPAGSDEETVANFTHVGCFMENTGPGGFGTLNGNVPSHQYTEITAGGRRLTNGRIGSTPNTFLNNISGNVLKNEFCLKFMNKILAGTSQAEGLAKLTLKAGGDPDQLIFIIPEVLYYSLLIYKDQVQQGAPPARTLHQIFKEIFNKYILITCDGVLAGLARRFGFNYIQQIGNSIIYVKRQDTSADEKVLSQMCSMKEKLKKEMEEYVSLISKCKSFTTYIVFGEGNSYPLIGSNEVWSNLEENKKLLKIAIQKHYTEIEDIPTKVVNNIVPGNIHKLTTMLELYKKPIITKTTKMTMHGAKITIYQWNYIQSLSILISLGIPIDQFLFCTEITRNDRDARALPEYQGALAAANTAADAADAAAAAAPGPVVAPVPQPSILTISLSQEPDIAGFLSNTPPPPQRPAASQSPSASNSIAHARARRLSESGTNILKITASVTSKRISTVVARDCSQTRSSARIRSLLNRQPVIRNQGGGGKSHEYSFQMGGCQEPSIDEVSIENLYKCLGDDAECQWIPAVPAEDVNDVNDVKIYIDCQGIMGELQAENNILSVKLPFLHFWIYALLASMDFNLFLSIILDVPNYYIQREIIQDYISTLKDEDQSRRRSVEISSLNEAVTERARAREEAAAAAEAAEAAAAEAAEAAEAEAAEAAAAEAARAREEAAAARAREEAAAAQQEQEEEEMQIQELPVADPTAALSDLIQHLLSVIRETPNVRGLDRRRQIETFFQDIIGRGDSTRNLFNLCRFIDNINQRKTETNDIPPPQPLFESLDEAQEYVDTGRGDGPPPPPPGGAGAAVDSRSSSQPRNFSGQLSCSRSVSEHPVLSLEAAGEVFSCLYNTGVRFADVIPVSFNPDPDNNPEDADTDAPTYFLSKLRQLENTIITRNDDRHCIVALQRDIPDIIKNIGLFIRAADETTAAAADETTAAAEAAVNNAVKLAADIVGNVVSAQEKSKHEQKRTKQETSTHNEKELSTAISSLQGLSPENRTDTTEFVAWLCRCTDALTTFQEESMLDVTRLRNDRYQYLRYDVLECVPATSVSPGRQHLLEGDSQPHPPLSPVSFFGSQLIDSQTDPPDRMDDDGKDGGRRRVKKSTRRKQRRYTRNYNSRNQRNSKTNKKYVTKRKKSHTIKRSKNSRRHRQ